MQTMPNITMVTDTNFDSVVAESQKPVLLAIGAQWCPDCRRLQPLFMQFAKDYSDKLVLPVAISTTTPASRKSSMCVTSLCLSFSKTANRSTRSLSPRALLRSRNLLKKQLPNVEKWRFDPPFEAP